MIMIPRAGEMFRASDGTVSTVLPENDDPNYEPSEEELLEYAEFIGIDIAKEPYLLHVAKEGLRTPLPKDWRACQTNEDELYYFNFKTGESQWDHPLDDIFRQKVKEERARHEQPSSREPEEGVGKAASGALSGLSTAATAQEPGSASSPALPSGTSNIFSRGSNGLSGSGQWLRPVLGSGPMTGAGGGATSAPMNSAKDIEDSIRKRLAEEYAPLRRALQLEMDKALMDERASLEDKKKSLVRELEEEQRQRKEDAAVRQVQLQNELRGIEESWERHLQEVALRVTELRNAVEGKRKSMDDRRMESLKDLQNRLAAKVAEEVEQQRVLLSRSLDAQLEDLSRQHEAALAALQKDEDEALRVVKVQLEAGNRKKWDAQERHGTKMVESLEADVQRLRVQNERLEDEGAYEAVATPVFIKADEALDFDALKKAEVKAKEEIEHVAAECAAATTKLREEYDVKQRELEAELAHAAEQRSLAEAELAQLQAVEQSLHEDLDEAKRQYAQETMRLVQSQAHAALQVDEGVISTPSLSANAPPSYTSATSLQERRAIDTASTRHHMLLQQLQVKHECAMQRRGAEHRRILQTRNLPDPRKSSGYNKIMVDRKKAWHTEHPAPAQTLPKLKPVPTFSPKMENVSSVSVPTPEEVRACAEQQLHALRAQHATEQTEALAKINNEEKDALESLRCSYREKRLQEVDNRIRQLREETAATRVAQEEEAIQKLESELQQLRCTHEAQMQVMRDALNASERRLQVAAAKRGASVHTANMQQPAAESLSISQQSAAASETELHATWQRRLGALRAAIQRQTDRYYNLLNAMAPPHAHLDEAHRAHTPVEDTQPLWMSQTMPAKTDSAAVGAVEEQRPIGLTQSHQRPPLSGTARPIKYVTPLNSLEDGADATGAAALAGYVAASATPQPTCSSSLNASSILPLHGAQLARSLRENDHTMVQNWLCGRSHSRSDAVRGDNSILFMMPQLGESAMPLASTQPLTVFSGPSHSPPCGDGRTGKGAASPTALGSVYSERLQRLRAGLREHQRVLRTQKACLEQLREQWRVDMRECRRHFGNSAQISALYGIRKQLEAEARRFNKAAVSLREAAALMREAVSHSRCAMPSSNDGDFLETAKSMGAALPRSNAVSPAYNGRRECVVTPQEPLADGNLLSHSCSVAQEGSVLQAIVRATERLEQLERRFEIHTPSRQRQRTRLTAQR